MSLRPFRVGSGFLPNSKNHDISTLLHSHLAEGQSTMSGQSQICFDQVSPNVCFFYWSPIRFRICPDFIISHYMKISQYMPDRPLSLFMILPSSIRGKGRKDKSAYLTHE